MGVQSLSLSVLCHLPGCILTNFSFLPCCLWSSTEDVGRGAVRVQLFSEVMNLRRAVLVAVALLCLCPCLRCVIAVILDTRLLGLLFLFLAKTKPAAGCEHRSSKGELLLPWGLATEGLQGGSSTACQSCGLWGLVEDVKEHHRRANTWQAFDLWRKITIS